MSKSEHNKGSAWRKWDLQIQPIKDEWFSDLGNKVNEIKSATKDYLKKAVENEVSVVAITDHNCGVGIDAALEVVKDEKLDIVVLRGVEIDVNTGYQILVIFNPAYKDKIGKQTWAETIEHFLNNVCHLPSPVIKTDGQAESINGDIHEILNKVCKEDIGLPIFAHCQSDKGLFKKTTGANRKKFFECANEGKYHFALDHKTDVNIEATETVLKGWSYSPNQFALIKTSDAHQASNVGENYTWVKSERTYEGLKQIIYDQQSRVALTKNAPVQPNNIIESIKFNVPTEAKLKIRKKDGSEKEEPFCFAGAQGTYHLSPFLNCFIGGRGSGKSTVLNFLGQHSKDPSSSQAFWNKIQPTFDTANSGIFSFNGVEIFEYIGQSEVESFATNKEAFTNAIYERANILSDGLLEKDEEKLSILLRRISSFRVIVENIEESLEEQEAKEKEKKILENSIKITKSKEYEDIVGKITNKSNQKQQLESWREIIEGLRGSVGTLKEEYFSEDVFGNESDGNDSSESSDAKIAEPYQKAFEAAQKNIDKAEEILDEKNFKELVKKEQALVKGIDEHEKELSKLLKKSGLSEENILQVKSAPQKLVKINDELGKIKKRIDDRQAELKKYSSVVSEAHKVKAEYEKVIEASIKPLVNTLEKQAKENDKEDIKDIGLTYFFDELQAWREIANDFYTYFSEHRDGERGDLLKNYIVDNRAVFSESKNKICKALDDEEKGGGYIKFLKDVFSSDSDFQIFQTIRDKHLNDVASHKQIQVLYDGKDIERASFGQKCTAVMVILLLFGNYPLIIDEPEAHLDGSLIANYLVPLIKHKKNNRQIIFATHNANFVVNGDAEKIFILKNETGTTEFIEATIEDLSNRDELLKLEGGREAFKKRGEKLDI